MNHSYRKRRFPLIIIFFLLVLAPALHPQSEDTLYPDNPSWRQALGGAVTGHPVAQAESVVATTDGGNLKSYSSQGTPLWDYYARGRLTPYVSRSREGTSYICRTNGLLIAVNRAGRELWQIDMRTPIIFPVLTGWDGRLFVFTNGKISCMTAAGYTLWSKPLEKKAAFAPVRDAAGGVILVEEDGEVLRFDPFGNVFSFPAGAFNRVPGTATITTTAPTGAASLEIDGWGHAILLVYRDGHMELVYTTLGYGESLRGKVDLPAAPLAVTGRKHEAAVLLENGQVLLLSAAAENRKILWSAAGHIRQGDLPARPGSEDLDLFYDERGIYVITRTGATGFAADGRRLWHIRFKLAAAIPSFGDDGVLYAGGPDWILYAYRLEERVKARQRVLYGEAPEGSYGVGSPGPSSWADHPFRFDETELNGRLAEIRRAVRDGDVGINEKEYTAWLMETAGCFLSDPLAGNRPQVHARHRVEAASLLAYIGSRETIPFLAELFRRDPEVTVKAAAALAIGKIGVDPDGLALGAFEEALSPPSPALDETALTAVASGAGSLCRFSGPPLSAAGIRILTLLSGADKPPRTRRQAERELASLKK